MSFGFTGPEFPYPFEGLRYMKIIDQSSKDFGLVAIKTINFDSAK
jgi:hypothetical protein